MAGKKELSESEAVSTNKEVGEVAVMGRIERQLGYLKNPEARSRVLEYFSRRNDSAVYAKELGVLESYPSANCDSSSAQSVPEA